MSAPKFLPSTLDRCDQFVRWRGSREPHGNFTGEIIIDSKNRPEGTRIKFRMKRNSVKIC